MDVERIHILVVDDVADVAESTAELLNFWGYDATACTSGAAALLVAQTRRPAAVILDLVMPRMDGFRFAQEFRRLPGCEEVPLIALSGYVTPECAIRARQVGIGHYLLKPADPNRLQTLLAQLTQLKAGSPDLRAGKRWGGWRKRIRRWPLLSRPVDALR